MSEEIPVNQQQQYPHSGSSNATSGQHLAGTDQAAPFAAQLTSENFGQFSPTPTSAQTGAYNHFPNPFQPQTQAQPPLVATVGAAGAESNEAAKLQEMELEAAKLRQLNASMQGDDTGAGAVGVSDEEKREKDSRSIYVGNVDYAVTPQELATLFSQSGVVNKVTILTNKFTGQPKGFAYLEFSDIDGVNKAVATQDGAMLRDRELKVSAKRTNIPGLSSTNRGGRGGRGRGGFRARGRGGMRGGFRGGRGGAFRGGSRFAPY